jgi:hypothetical protein
MEQIVANLPDYGHGVMDGVAMRRLAIGEDQ